MFGGVAMKFHGCDAGTSVVDERTHDCAARTIVWRYVTSNTAKRFLSIDGFGVATEIERSLKTRCAKHCTR
jgi:hypothetical protein